MDRSGEKSIAALSQRYDHVVFNVNVYSSAKLSRTQISRPIKPTTPMPRTGNKNDSAL